MEIVVQLCLTIVYCYVAWNFVSKIIRSIVLFLISIFSFQILISIFDFNGNTLVSISTYILFNINIISFVLGCCLVNRLTISKIKKTNILL